MYPKPEFLRLLREKEELQLIQLFDWEFTLEQAHKFWLGLQMDYDLEAGQYAIHEQLKSISSL